MNTYTKIILWGLFFLFIVSVVFAYFRFFVAQDYVIHGEVSCDPAEEACFVYECDPEVEECTGDPEEDTWYYKMISKRAAFMPVCEADAEECPEPTCSIGEADCEVITCSESTLAEAGEGIYCSDPADFQEELEGETMEEEALDETEEAATDESAVESASSEETDQASAEAESTNEPSEADSETAPEASE